MYIDFEDLRPETPRVEGALSVREGVLISIIVHLLLFIAVLFLPDLLPESVRPVPVTRCLRRQQDPAVRVHAAARRHLQAAAESRTSTHPIRIA